MAFGGGRTTQATCHDDRTANGSVSLRYTFLTPQSYHAQYVNVVPPGAIIELDGITMNSAAMGGDRLPQRS